MPSDGEALHEQQVNQGGHFSSCPDLLRGLARTRSVVQLQFVNVLRWAVVVRLHKSALRTVNLHNASLRCLCCTWSPCLRRALGCLWWKTQVVLPLVVCKTSPPNPGESLHCYACAKVHYLKLSVIILNLQMCNMLRIRDTQSGTAEPHQIQQGTFLAFHCNHGWLPILKTPAGSLGQHSLGRQQENLRDRQPQSGPLRFVPAISLVQHQAAAWGLLRGKEANVPLPHRELLLLLRTGLRVCKPPCNTSSPRKYGKLTGK